MCLFRCLRRINLFCNLLLFIFSYIMLASFNILIIKNYNYTNDYIYLTKKYRIHYVQLNFFISIIFMFLLLLVIFTSIDKDEYNMNRISRLIKAKKFLEEENDFLKKKMEIPLHIKKIVIDYFIEKGDSMCSICLSDMETNSETFLTICGHLYHKECIDKSLEHSNKCPYCRTNIDYGNLDFYSDED